MEYDIDLAKSVYNKHAKSLYLKFDSYYDNQFWFIAENNFVDFTLCSLLKNTPYAYAEDRLPETFEELLLKYDYVSIEEENYGLVYLKDNVTNK